MAGVLANAPGIENVQTGTGFDQETGHLPIVEYSFRDESGHSQHNLFAVYGEPDGNGLYGYDRGSIRDGDWATDTGGFQKLMTVCRAVGYTKLLPARI